MYLIFAIGFRAGWNRWILPIVLAHSCSSVLKTLQKYILEEWWACWLHDKDEWKIHFAKISSVVVHLLFEFSGRFSLREYHHQIHSSTNLKQWCSSQYWKLAQISTQVLQSVLQSVRIKLLFIHTSWHLFVRILGQDRAGIGLIRVADGGPWGFCIGWFLGTSTSLTIRHYVQSEFFHIQ